MRVIEKIVYQCEFCGSQYATFAEAEACASLPSTPLFQPGDIVVDVRSEGLWMDEYTKKGIFDHLSSRHEGEPHCAVPGVYRPNPWIYKVGHSINNIPAVAPYFVVTLVTLIKDEKHVFMYHLYSMFDASRGVRVPFNGWTCQETHVAVKKPEAPPPAVVIKVSKKLIGMKSKHLLRCH